MFFSWRIILKHSFRIQHDFCTFDSGIRISRVLHKGTHKIHSFIANTCSYRAKPVGAFIFWNTWNPRMKTSRDQQLKRAPVAIATASFRVCFVNATNKYRNNNLKDFKCIYNIWTVFCLLCFISLRALPIPKRNINLKNYKPKILTPFFTIMCKSNTRVSCLSQHGTISISSQSTVI